MRRQVLIAVLLVMAGALAACGSERSDNAVEAREGNEAVLGGVKYSVESFRELNVRVEPELYRGSPPSDRSGYFAAFLRACTVGGEPARTTSSIHLENAFGKTYRPKTPERRSPVAYEATTLQPDECHPASDSLAAQALPGAVLVFEVPYADLSARPMVLEIRDPDADASARIQLDL
jgi:hypothetical protein